MSNHVENERKFANSCFIFTCLDYYHRRGGPSSSTNHPCFNRYTLLGACAPTFIVILELPKGKHEHCLEL